MNDIQNLLGKSPIVSNSTIKKVIEHDLEIRTGAFNKLKLDLVRKKIKNKKTVRLDGIYPKVSKTVKFKDLLLYYCNEVYNENVIHS